VFRVAERFAHRRHALVHHSGAAGRRAFAGATLGRPFGLEVIGTTPATPYKRLYRLMEGRPMAVTAYPVRPMFMVALIGECERAGFAIAGRCAQSHPTQAQENDSRRYRAARGSV
jgi:hypothetical protein